MAKAHKCWLPRKAGTRNHEEFSCSTCGLDWWLGNRVYLPGRKWYVGQCTAQDKLTGSLDY